MSPILGQVAKEVLAYACCDRQESYYCKDLSHIGLQFDEY